MNITDQNIPAQRAYWDRVAADFDSIYTKDKSKLARWLDRVFRVDMFQRFEYTLRQSEPVAERTFLDVGCGSGHYCLALAQRGAQKILGIDIAPNMIQKSRELLDASGLSRVCEFHAQTVDQLSNTEVFDAVIGIGLLDYVPNPLELLRQMHCHARDRVILSFPRINTWRAPIRKLRLTMRGCSVYFYSRSEVYRLIKEAGGRIIDFQVVGKLFCTTSQPNRTQKF
jgi:2-polyprenyl-3-methyl-5-hydroxy-6-metoxy-1,4-benzoquinol methylase